MSLADEILYCEAVSRGLAAALVVRGSDVDRDGMYLELTRDGQQGEIAEIFYADQTGELSINTFGNSVSLAAVEWLVERSRALLPPIRQ